MTIRKEKYTKEVLSEIVKTSDSLSEVLRKLGANPSGNTRNHIKNKIKKFDISTEHFTFNRSKRNYLKKDSSSYLCLQENNVRVPTRYLKAALIESGLTYKCMGENCQLVDGITWGGEELTLDVDHIDGNYRNNVINNLRFLCPNCHRLTKTFGYKGKPKNTCEECSKPVGRRSIRCVTCSNKNKLRGNAGITKFDYPPLEELIKGVELYGYRKYATLVGLSDNGLRKLLVRMGVKQLPQKIKNM